MNGQGKITTVSGVYEGEIKNGQSDGYGVYTYNHNPQYQVRYEGQWKEGKQSGHGILSYVGGSYYEGQWENGRRHGQGTLHKKGVFRRTTLSGVWVNDTYDWSHHKLVSWVYRNLNEEYTGDKKDDKPHGYGKCKNSYGEYEGNWEEGERSGQGIMRFADGCVYDGQWKQNKFEGFGRYANPEAMTYEGQWKNHLMDGSGSYRHRDGRSYEGPWEKGLPHGEGAFSDGQGNTLTGIFRKGRFYEGELRLSDGTVTSVKRGKPENRAVLEALPLITKALLKKTRKEDWF